MQESETVKEKGGRIAIEKVVMQGSVLGPIICSNQISKSASTALDQGNVYLYKDIVPIPPLSMVDDIVAISKCNGISNVDLDTHCDTFAKLKRIKFKPSKCSSIHIGHNTCTTVHCVDDLPINLDTKTKYLADLISNSPKCLFEDILNRAKRLKVEIASMARELSFGHHLYEISVKLLDSMYRSSIAINMETWHEFDHNWIDKFEKL